MPYQHPYKPNGDNGEPRQKEQGTEPPRAAYTGVSDLDDAIHEVVQTGSAIGSQVLSSIGDALRSVGEALGGGKLGDKSVPFDKWKKRIDRYIKNEKQDSGTALAVVGWTFAAIFGIATLVMTILSGVGPAALSLTREEWMVFPILMACFAPITSGFCVMGVFGVKNYRRYVRLRSYLRFARDWVCPVSELARQTGVPANQVRSELQKAVADGLLPGVMLSPDCETLYLDDTRYTPPAPDPVPAPETPAEATPTEAECLRVEGAAFLGYLRACRGKLDAGADEQLTIMEKNCSAILGFVHNHPEQLPRLRRFREYYLPTTRKLLDTAMGLGSTDAASANQIRGEITGILHTLNLAYSKLYDTLLQDVSLDVSTEIDTLETMLRQDGLTHDFEQDFGGAAQ